MPNNCNWITPSWPAPVNVHALTTLRTRGQSLTLNANVYSTLAIAPKLQVAIAMGEQLKIHAKVPADPFWLSQVHGTNVVKVSDYSLPYPIVEADASVAFNDNEICAILTADCLPILFCNQAGTRIAAAHAGWRGLANGVIEATVEKMGCAPETVMAWLGPAIGPEAFEVKEDVLVAFTGHSLHAFKPTAQGTWLANLYQLATERLRRLGIRQIFGGEFCAYTDLNRFYSYRRSKDTGRMATLIWLTPT